MRPLVLTLVLGLASAAVQGNFQPPNSGILQERTLGLDEILGDISSGGLLGLKAQKIAFLCKLVDKAESIAGFVGGLKLESHLKKKLEFFLKDKCKKTTETQPPPSTSVPPPESQTSPSTTSSPPETSSPSTPPPETKTTPPETKTTPPETKTTPPETKTTPPETKTSPPPETTPPKETTPTPETTPPKETSPPAPPTETTPTPETTPPKETPPPPATTPETETSPPPGTTPPKETTPATPGTPPKETSPPGTTPPNETTPTPETTPPNETSPPPDTTPPKGPESSFITKTTPNNSPPPVTLPPPTPTTAPPTTPTITECIDVTTAIPPCATGCFSSAGSQVGCSDKDFGCFCKPGSQEQLSMLVQQCVSTACPPESATSVSMGVSSVCSCFPNPPVPTNTGVPPTPCTPGSGDDCTQTKPQPEPTTPGVPPGCTGGEGDCSASPPKPGVTTTPSQGMPCPIVNGTGIDCTRPTSPPVVTAAADRFSFGLVECVLGGAAWLALAL
ncbi:Extracellular membrane protein, CFEM domain protein [Metarhizium robertsii ARSEF 23]|uniref:Extracellular membrane protein, CFEM domain protein n=1 Tax=Metarhizium robertsii (strain ARSEF 23 / ATCC MYA-3075) TaxID=655844 RepID=E9F636_METRA|nr:Extracellular membrane protein, CFEM domain protein [Metarhizium robertsii ARSEF 23]EFY96922.1 Extracellular membrane protein, CFEM domain protein [Metarhizium robertsii ARSEF 23]